MSEENELRSRKPEASTDCQSESNSNVSEKEPKDISFTYDP